MVIRVGTVDIQFDDITGSPAFSNHTHDEGGLSVIPNSGLSNSSIGIASGNGLKNGATVSLGGSVTLDVEPNGISGVGLQDDGTDNLEINQGFSPNWTGGHEFSSGITMSSAINMQGSNKIVDLPAPDNAGDAARKTYVDGVAQGLNLKDSVRAATDGTNIDLTSATDPNPIDGVTLNNGDRVLLKDQTDGTENGIYDAVTATDPTTWVRSNDADEDAEVTSGLFTFITEGTVNGNTSQIIITEDPITLGTTVIEFAQFSAAGEITAGDGLTKAGQTLDISVADFVGQFLSDDGTNDIQVNITNGLETDGANNIRTSGGNIAGGFLSEGTSPHQVSVNLGAGVEGDGSNNIRVDEDTDFTFTSAIDFTAGLDVQGDITDGTQVIWDVTAQEIPDSALGSIANATLTNDSVTFSAGGGLTGGGSVALGNSATIDIGAGSFITVNANTIDVNIGNGLETDGVDNIRVNPGAITGNGLVEDTTTTLGIATDGVQADELDTTVSFSFTNLQTISQPTSSDILRLQNSSTNDGLRFSVDASDRFLLQTRDDSASVTRDLLRILPASDQVDVVSTLNFPNITGTPSFASHSHSEGGLTAIPNTGLVNSAITLNGGDGLKNGSTASLGGSFSLDIEPGDFAGSFLNDDGADNLAVQIGRGLEDDGTGNIQFDEDTDYTFTTQIDFSAGLDTQGDIVDGAQVIWDVGAQEIPDSALGSIDNATLTNSSITVTAGNALTGGGSISLGNSATINVDESAVDIANISGQLTDAVLKNTGDVLAFSTDGNNDLTIQNTTDATTIFTIDENTGDILSSNVVPNAALDNSSVTITSGDGLKSGGAVSLGGSVTIDIEPADFAGTFLSDDGTDNLTVDIGLGLENDGTGNIRVNEDTDFTFTSAIDFSAGLDVQGDITDGTQVIWDVSLQEIPDSALGSIDNATLTNSSVTITAGDGLVTGGTVSLGNSVTLDVSSGSFTSISADGVNVNIGNGLEGDGANNIRVRGDQVAGVGLTEDGTNPYQVNINVNGGIQLTSGQLEVAAGQDLTQNSGGLAHADTSTQGNVSAGAGAAITGINLDGRGHTTSINTTDFDGRFLNSGGDTMTGNLSMNNNQILGANRLELFDRDSDGNNWRLIENGTNGHLNFDSVGGGGTQMDLEHNGNLRIEGSLTEGAAL